MRLQATHYVPEGIVKGFEVREIFALHAKFSFSDGGSLPSVARYHSKCSNLNLNSKHFSRALTGLVGFMAGKAI